VPQWSVLPCSLIIGSVDADSLTCELRKSKTREVPMECPKCSYLRKPSDEAPDWQCPSCGVAYAKVIAAQQEKMRNTTTVQEDEDDEWEREERLGLAARGQKMMIHGLLLGILLGLVLRSVPSLPIPTSLVNIALLAAIGVYMLIGAVKVCSGLEKGQGQKILFMVLMFLPLFSVIALLYLSMKATGLLRKAGIEVGLFGAKS
jgi:small basic protein/ribosomal protein L37AE/L43A